MVEIASDRPLFKTILVEMAYSVIHLHNRVNKSRIQYFGYKQVRKKSAGLQMFFTEPAAFEPCASQFQTLP
jgi:hypothetical protein